MFPKSPAIARDDRGLPATPTRMHARDSVTRRVAGDVRNLLMSGSIFTLQVAHPSVGAGVAEHSRYREDPWTRLADIDASGRRFLWTDEAAARAEGRRLRAIHRDIAGVDGQGRRYHALDPHGYGWVHWVFLDSMLRSTELYGDVLSAKDEDRLFVEWYEAALLLGLRDTHLPKTLAEYCDEFARIVREELEYTSVVAHLLGDRVGPPPPPWASLIPRHVWASIIRPAGVTSQWLALAGLPVAFREKIHAHHPWTTADDARLEVVAAIVRATVPRLPPRVRWIPDARRARATERAASSRT